MRSRNWAFLIYQEDLKCSFSECLKKLTELGVCMAISPLHIPDSECKKPHYHCLMAFDGVKSGDTLSELNNMVTGLPFDWSFCSNRQCPYFFQVNALGNYFRYLVHLDNREKQQFSGFSVCAYPAIQDNSIILLGGFNPRDYLERNMAVDTDSQILEIILNNGITSLNELIVFLVANKNVYLKNVVKSQILWYRSFFKDKLYLKENEQKKPDLKELAHSASS